MVSRTDIENDAKRRVSADKGQMKLNLNNLFAKEQRSKSEEN